jgi:hypothetical protein
MDFKGIVPDDLAQLTPVDLAEAIKPGGPEAAFGGELIPTLTGQQNIKEQLFRRGVELARKEDRRFYYNARNAVDNYIVAAENGDTEAALKLAEELENVYSIRFRGGSMIQRAMEARAISKQMRMVDPKLGGDPKMFDRYMKIFRAHGIGLEP